MDIAGRCRRSSTPAGRVRREYARFLCIGVRCHSYAAFNCRGQWCRNDEPSYILLCPGGCIAGGNTLHALHVEKYRSTFASQSDRQSILAIRCTYLVFLYHWPRVHTTERPEMSLILLLLQTFYIMTNICRFNDCEPFVRAGRIFHA